MYNFSITAKPKIYSSGFFYKINTVKKQEYVFTIECQLIQGDEAFIYCEDEQYRPFISRDNKILLKENKNLTFKISGIGKIINFGILFSGINMNYELQIKRIEVKKEDEVVNNINNMILHKGAILCLEGEIISDLNRYNSKHNQAKIILNKKIKNKISQTITELNFKYENMITESNKNISIILPIFNNNKKYENCLNKLLLQNYKNMEIIVVTNHDLENITCSDKDITVIKLDEINYGKIINHGISKSKYNYVTILNEQEELKCENSLNQIMNEEFEHFIYSNFESSNNSFDGEYKNLEELINNYNGIGMCIWNKSLLKRLGKYNEMIIENTIYEYIVRTFNNYKKTKYYNEKILVSKNNVIKNIEYIKYCYFHELMKEINYYKNNSLITITNCKNDILPNRICQITKFIKTNSKKIIVENNKDLKLQYHKEILVMSMEIFKILYTNFENPKIMYNSSLHNKIIDIMEPQNTIYDFTFDQNINDENILWSICISDIIICSDNQNMEILNEITQNKKIWYIPNGYNSEIFKMSALENQTKPADLPQKKNKIIGFIGTIDENIDIDLLKRIADLNLYIIVIIGNISKNKYRFDHPYTKWLNRIEYDKVPEYMKWFDLCILPYKINDRIKNVIPIKYYEYCALDKKIIGTLDINDNINYYKINEENLNEINNILKKNYIPNEMSISNDWNNILDKFEI